MNWQQNLTKEQRKHIRKYALAKTLTEFLKMREAQKNLGIRCYECEACERALLRAGVI